MAEPGDRRAEIAESLRTADQMLRQGQKHDAAIIHLLDAVCGLAALLGVPGAIEPETGAPNVTTTEG